MKRDWNTIETFTFQGLLELCEEKLGRKKTMELSQILYLHHLTQRNICGSNDEDMKTYLINEGYGSVETMELVKRYKMYKRDLFDYSWKQQSIMDRSSMYLDPLVRFRQVENRHLGVIEKKKRKKVVDISTPGKSIEVCDITNGIVWKETNLSVNQLHLIKEWGQNIKEGLLV